MAALVKEIAITKQLRPCEVEIYNEKRKGLFHEWALVDDIVKGAPTRCLYAVVETEDGKVYRIRPNFIRFLDTSYIFNELPFGSGNEKE